MGQCLFALETPDKEERFHLVWQALCTMRGMESMMTEAKKGGNEKDINAVRMLEDLHYRGYGIVHNVTARVDKGDIRDIPSSGGVSERTTTFCLCVAAPQVASAWSLRARTEGPDVPPDQSQWGWECMNLIPVLPTLFGVASRARVAFNFKAITDILSLHEKTFVVREKNAQNLAKTPFFVLYSPKNEVFCGSEGGWVEEPVVAARFPSYQAALKEANSKPAMNYVPLEMTLSISGATPEAAGPILTEALAWASREGLRQEVLLSEVERLQAQVNVLEEELGRAPSTSILGKRKI